MISIITNRRNYLKSKWVFLPLIWREKRKKNGDYTSEEFEQYGKALKLILTHIFNTTELKYIYSDICDMIYA